MNQQYDYALDHLKQMVKSTDNSNSGGEYTGVHMAVDLVFAAIIIGAYVAGYYYF